jgi:hypothetical protein
MTLLLLNNIESLFHTTYKAVQRNVSSFCSKVIIRYIILFICFTLSLYSTYSSMTMIDPNYHKDELLYTNSFLQQSSPTTMTTTATMTTTTTTMTSILQLLLVVLIQQMIVYGLVLYHIKMYNSFVLYKMKLIHVIHMYVVWNMGLYTIQIRI